MVCKWTGLWISKAEVMALTSIMDNFNWTSSKNLCPIENYPKQIHIPGWHPFPALKCNKPGFIMISGSKVIDS